MSHDLHWWAESGQLDKLLQALSTGADLEARIEDGMTPLQLAVAKGYRIAAVSGEVWVTQSGFIEDYVLRRGDVLTLVSDGPAVVTSFGPADIEVIAPPSTQQSALDIGLDAIERARQEAHRLRAEAMHEMFSAAWAGLGRVGRRLAGVAAPVEGRSRQPC